MLTLLFDIPAYSTISVKNIGGHDFIPSRSFIHRSCKENGSGIVVLSTERRLLYSMFLISCCFFYEGNSGNLIEYAEYANAANSRFGLSLASPRLPRNSRKASIFHDKKESKVKLLSSISTISILYICVQ